MVLQYHPYQRKTKMVEAETKLARLAEWVRKNMDREGGFLKSDLYSFARKNDIERSALDFIYRCRKRGTMRDVNSKRIEVLIPKSRKLDEFYKDLLKIQDEPVLQGRPKPPLRKKKEIQEEIPKEAAPEKEPVIIRPPRRKIIRPETLSLPETDEPLGKAPSSSELPPEKEARIEKQAASPQQTKVREDPRERQAAYKRSRQSPEFPAKQPAFAGPPPEKEIPEEKQVAAEPPKTKEVLPEKETAVTAAPVKTEASRKNKEPEVTPTNNPGTDSEATAIVNTIAQRLEDRFQQMDDKVSLINRLVETRIDDLEKRISLVVVRELEKRIHDLENQLAQFREKAEAFDIIKSDAWEIIQSFEVVEKEREDVKNILKKFLNP